MEAVITLPPSLYCELCKRVLNNSSSDSMSDSDRYLIHLMFFHTYEEIHNSAETDKTISALISDNIEKPSLSNPLNKTDLLTIYVKIASSSNKYKMAQCVLCENSVNENIMDFESHLTSIHNVTKMDSQFIYSFFNTAYDLTLNETELVKCKECGLLIENKQIYLRYHNDFHLEGSQKNPKNLSDNANKPNLYCCLCQKMIDHSVDTYHLHFSYLNSEMKDNELISSQISYNNTNGIFSYANMEVQNMGMPNFINQNILQIPQIGNKVPHPEVEMKMKEWELYSSLSRSIDEKINIDFKSKFGHEMFEYVDIVGKDPSLHFYSNEEKGSTATLLKRLNNEFTKLSRDLSCDFSSSYFIRADVNYPQFVKVLIAGSRGSPYEHGLFEFDLYFPLNYPNAVPKCILKTTNNGKIRFNPNLYNNGTVCLSLLGTWPGSSFEQWDPKTSNLIQILISLSSIVMNDKIIENEPGFENYLNSSTQALLENEGYANIVRLGNISYAMIDNIVHPSPIYDSLIADYFKFKSEELLADISTWIDRAQYTQSLYTGLTSAHNLEWASIIQTKGYESILKDKIDELKKLLI